MHCVLALAKANGASTEEVSCVVQQAEGETAPEQEASASKASTSEAAPSGAALNFWGMASALAETVKKTTADLADRYVMACIGSGHGACTA